MTIEVERIMQLAQENGETGNNLETQLGLAGGVFSKWRLDKAKPSTEALTKIAQHYNVSTDYLLGLTDDRNWQRFQDMAKVSVNADEDELLSCFRVLEATDTENAKAILNVIRCMATKKL